ncbi:MAG: Ribosome-binding factor A [Parcubacteria group bacterium GW2011_GWA2_50_10b]|nr:MAG: Ribosome-binding factor A [Parcubacteria group bacterium GW2011_GWA2_50_10b]
MREIKREIITEILHRLAAQFAREEGSDSSLLTITRVEISPTGKEAKIFFTTLPESQEDTALKFLERKTPEFKRYIRDESRLGIIPHVDFKIDYGERNRQRLDELSQN